MRPRTQHHSAFAFAFHLSSLLVYHSFFFWSLSLSIFMVYAYKYLLDQQRWRVIHSFDNCILSSIPEQGFVIVSAWQYTFVCKWRNCGRNIIHFGHNRFKITVSKTFDNHFLLSSIGIYVILKWFTIPLTSILKSSHLKIK